MIIYILLCFLFYCAYYSYNLLLRRLYHFFPVFSHVHVVTGAVHLQTIDLRYNLLTEIPVIEPGTELKVRVVFDGTCFCINLFCKKIIFRKYIWDLMP